MNINSESFFIMIQFNPKNRLMNMLIYVTIISFCEILLKFVN